MKDDTNTWSREQVAKLARQAAINIGNTVHADVIVILRQNGRVELGLGHDGFTQAETRGIVRHIANNGFDVLEAGRVH